MGEEEEEEKEWNLDRRDSGFPHLMQEKKRSRRRKYLERK